jgi:hypothetical protein
MLQTHQEWNFLQLSIVPMGDQVFCVVWICLDSLKFLFQAVLERGLVGGKTLGYEQNWQIPGSRARVVQTVVVRAKSSGLSLLLVMREMQ